MEIIKGDKTIHSERQWVLYYSFLERLRLCGVCNMFGATPYLQDAFDLSESDAATVLCNWMHNYDELNKKYGWRN